MTPKEKAQELIRLYRNIEFNNGENCHLIISLKDAKHCALIAVDEMLNWFKAHSYSDKNYDAFVFYQEVKQEIEKL